MELGNVRLVGKRVTLRPLRPDDATPRYVEWMNDPEVNRFLESRFEAIDVGSLRKFIAAVVSDPDAAMFAILENDHERHVGNIKVGPIARQHAFADIGLLVGEKDCWGRGYASEAIELVSRYATNDLGLLKLIAGCYEPNVGSMRAFQKAGYVVEGRLREKFRLGSDRVDHILLGYTKAPTPAALETTARLLSVTTGLRVAGIGVDLEEVSRFRVTTSDRLRHAFTRAEIEESRHRSEPAVYFASRFAAKEAVIKALGSAGLPLPAMLELVISRDDEGAPRARLPRALSGLEPRLRISFSHTDEHALAVAVLTHEEASQ